MRTILNSSNASETKKFAKSIGSKLQGGEVIELVSDLGGGKTTFVAGLAEGAGSSDQVASPTFTVSKTYKTSGLTIKHFDFYRLAAAGILSYELSEATSDPKTVVIVEWGGIVEKTLPKERLRINFSVEGENLRRLELDYPKNLAYLIKGL